MTSLSKNRIESIDLLKGLVMVLMALDHTRDYFYQTRALYDITNPEHASIPLYVSRWITHFCAPTFSFLEGFLLSCRAKEKQRLTLCLFDQTRPLADFH
ncbi:hypothetical protein [Dyadobacter frigoris]|uniref:Uncharacterized protein n=1 Tax=Dyadobacter frigoris TaxID=2576211 RepID=A0A4U6CPG2_9BACT|nr:hypothetical protein [Dyadobacter frigoris]TKT85281.1 hypothetical protein FDK13_34075 [Dyadobacter frigoris]